MIVVCQLPHCYNVFCNNCSQIFHLSKQKLFKNNIFRLIFFFQSYRWTMSTNFNHYLCIVTRIVVDHSFSIKFIVKKVFKEHLVISSISWHHHIYYPVVCDNVNFCSYDFKFDFDYKNSHFVSSTFKTRAVKFAEKSSYVGRNIPLCCNDIISTSATYIKHKSDNNGIVYHGTINCTNYFYVLVSA